MKQKTIQALLYLSLIMLPFGNLLRFELGIGVNILALDVVLGIIFAVTFSAWLLSSKKNDLLSHKASIAFPFIGITVLSLVINFHAYTLAETAVAAAYIARLVIFCHLIYVLETQKEQFREQFIKYLYYSLGLYAIVGLFQYFFYPDLRGLFYQGWDEHLYRVFGTLFDPNFSGALFVAGFVLSIGYIGKKIWPVTKTNAFYIAGAVLHLFVLLLTYSRSSYLMFAATLATYALMTRKYMILTGLIVVFGIGIMLLPKQYRSEGVNLLRTASIDSRIEEYNQATSLFLEKPLFGVGFNAYRYAQHRHGFISEVNSAQSWINNHAGAGVPNSFLFVLATTGIVGFSVYFLLIITIARNAYKSASKNMLRAAMFSVLCGLLVHALFENSLFYPFLLFIIASFVAHLTAHNNS